MVLGPRSTRPGSGARRSVLQSAVALVAAVVTFLGVDRAERPNGLVLRNESGVEVHDVALALTRSDGCDSVRYVSPNLESGRQVRLRHAIRDGAVSLEFVLAGERCVHTTPIIDLWTGEAWLLRILPDGGVAEGYGDT